MPVVTDYTALLSGSYWGGIEVTNKPTIVTYSFAASAPSYLVDVDGFTASTVSSFQAFSAAEQAQARAALAEWSAASGVVFVEVAGGKGDLNFQNVDFDTTSGPSYSGAGGVAFYPFGDWDYFSAPYFSGDLDASGDVFMNTRFRAGDGTVNYGTLLHEIGHALGLKHPTESVYGAFGDLHDEVLASDDPALTIMASSGDTLGGASDHLRQLDKDAIAHIYGDSGGRVVTGTTAGVLDDGISWRWDAPTETLRQTGTSGADAIRGSSVADIASGGMGNDSLFGLSGADRLDGGDGADNLDGGAGVDTMNGGAGDDVYFVDAVGDRIGESAGGGDDAVYAHSSYTLGANIERLYLTGAGLVGRGGSGDNVIFGDGAHKTVLYGFGGADYLVGGSAADALNGGAGGDSMFGGGGGDVYTVDNFDDYIFDVAGEGTDVVKVYASWDAYAGSETETIRIMTNAGLSISGTDTANVMIGGGGADTISGDSAFADTSVSSSDRLTGGARADVFLFRHLSDSPGGAAIDRITDFADGVDRISLAGVAESTGVALHYSASSAFSGAAGEVHALVSGGLTYVELDVDGDRALDMRIRLDGVHTLGSGDFLF
ncbi:M10 family metallopeptidase C-terminal domain-containing protein [Chelatococcus sambhunathii]|uniref:M10 family metallopeptidase C-terminal domain-containing protein n=1 Tax=Chelatococcus sambhunathii TaxID=363953 RepID=A0ABU1DBV0_9HYPH|nr:matrixin family metalloprotease [Chelatococcus sambhunathii]MDR4305509.1 M10 family metallopeptidase C-terminal domain-containing protein [Chelatococcus sambhunathii]